MKLTAIDVVKDLKALEIGEVYLFGGSSKSVSLIIREDNTPQLAVKLKGSVHFFSLSEKDKAQELFDKAFVITEDIYNNHEKFIEFIKTCEVGVKYQFSDGKRAIEIDVERDGTYHWTYSNGWHNQFPMKNTNYIKTFKTDMGARRSLIKYLMLDGGSY